ncbi:hypothetical protein L1987_00513 [Smallanthus sonchifolius]|uniref:Uncharacterized protein n=1 Tax=Smallanthus sonchifolius TaxID=185202 RepID=A0ACB9K2P1_9ASTR|nr:hypothetical protein L1987_00513 [Smallanthus sonchifolius]
MLNRFVTMKADEKKKPIERRSLRMPRSKERHPAQQVPMEEDYHLFLSLVDEYGDCEGEVSPATAARKWPVRKWSGKEEEGQQVDD